MSNAPSNSELAVWDPASRVVALIERIRPRYQRQGLPALNESERTLLVIFELDNEVCNGGFSQWLFNVPTECLKITPACLSRIGEEHVRHSIECIFEEVGGEAFALDWWAWQERLHAMPEDFWKRIRAYDVAFGAVERQMLDRLGAYATVETAKIRMP